MNLYAESSAILAWLLDEPTAPTVRENLAAADLVITSELTLIECQRALVRRVCLGDSTEAAAAQLQERLLATAAHWEILALQSDVIDRAGRPFPAEPIRTLDSIHLASALAAQSAVPKLAMLSHDLRIRSSALQLGFSLLPA